MEFTRCPLKATLSSTPTMKWNDTVKNSFLENRDLEADFTKDSKSCQPTCDEKFLDLREID